MEPTNKYNSISIYNKKNGINGGDDGDNELKENTNRIELGDIIQIISPNNVELHENKFFVYYLDIKEIGILNINSFEKYQLYFDANNYITDESIEQINLINRSDEKGYARQNGLISGKWIDVQFGGETPQIITGHIVDLEEDMIEIETIDGITIYIDFEYQGLPKELFIEKITIRPPPTTLAVSNLQNNNELENKDENEPKNVETSINENGETVIDVPENVQINKEITEELETLYLDTESIFAEDWFNATIIEEIQEKDRKYTFKEQIEAIKDELFSKIPNHLRTPDIENEINLYLRRYKELYYLLQNKIRENPQTNKLEYIKRDENYKPFIENLKKEFAFPTWIIPVVKQKRILFSPLEADEQQLLYEQHQYTHIDEQGNEFILSSSFIQKIAELIETYRLGKQIGDENRYSIFIRNILRLTKPSVCINAKNSLIDCTEIVKPFETIESNDDDFYYQNNEEKIGKYYLQKQTIGYKYPNKIENIDGFQISTFKQLQENSKITITSFITLPKPFILHSYLANKYANIYEQVNLSKHIIEKEKLLNIENNNNEIDKIYISKNGDDIDHIKLKALGMKTYMNEIKHFILQEQYQNENDFNKLVGNKYEKINKVLQSIIPSINNILQYFSSELKEKPTYYNAIKYLQLFGVSINDLTAKENKQIISFLKECKKIFNLEKDKKIQEFIDYANHTYEKDKYKSNVDLIDNLVSSEWKKLIETAYGNNNDEISFKSNTEFIQRIINLDGGNLYGFILEYLNESKNNIVEIDEEFANKIGEETEQIKQVAEISEMDRMTKQRILIAKELILQTKIKNNIELLKQTKTLFAFGKTIEIKKIPISPFTELRETIINYPDFVKKQNYIVQFVAEFCRPFIANDNNENPNWYYCKATNLPLFPTSLYELAISYLRDGSEGYQLKMDEICAKKGVLMENIIIDKETNFVLKMIDDVFQEVYNDEGFRVISYSTIEQSNIEKTEEYLNKEFNNTNILKIYSNENMQTIYNIYLAIMKNINLDPSICDNFLLRISSMLLSIPSYLPTEKQYMKIIIAKGKQNAKSYESYKNERLIYCVGSVLHIGLQTTIFDAKKAKVYSGCMKSFSGFPISGGEDTTGLQYMACVIKGTSNNTDLWKDIFKKKKDEIFEQIYNIINKYLLVIPEVDEAINKKKQYIAENSKLFEDVPIELSIKKWILFLPPLIPIKIKELHGIVSNIDLKNIHLEDLQKLYLYNATIHQHTFAIIELINNYVNKNATILNNNLGIPFLQNACCEKGEIQPLSFFQNKIGQEFDVYIKRINKSSEILKKWNNILTPPILFSKINFYNKHSSTKNHNNLIENSKKNDNEIAIDNANKNLNEAIIYSAFIHYCNLDNDFPIPDDLTYFFANKIDDYPKDADLDVKIDFLKRNGKEFNEENLKELMKIVNKRSLKTPDFIEQTHKNSIDIFKKTIIYLQQKNNDFNVSEGIPTKLCDLILDVLEHFNKSKLYNEKKNLNEPMQKAMYNLKRYLTQLNQNMLGTITDFLGAYPQKESNSKRTKCIKHIEDGIKWDILLPSNTERDKYTYMTVINSIKNSMYIYLSLLPSQILNNRKYKTILSEWGLSQKNNLDLEKSIDKFYNPLSVFFAEDSERTTENELIKQFYLKNNDWMNDLLLFSQTIPIFHSVWIKSNNEKNMQNKLIEYEEYNSLFGKNILLQLFEYCWLSMFQDSITSLSRVDLEKINKIQLRKQMVDKHLFEEEQQEFNRRINGDDSGEVINDLIDYEMKEIITMKNAVGLYIVGFLQQNMDEKKILDISYENIIAKKKQVALTEKKQITDEFAVLSAADRRIEYKLKTLGIGRWFVSESKLINYSKDVYDANREVVAEYKKIEKILDDDFDDLNMQNNNIADDNDNDELFLMRNEDEFDGNNDFDENDEW